MAHHPVQHLLPLMMINKGKELEQLKVSKRLLKDNGILAQTHHISVHKVRDKEADLYNQPLLVFFQYQLITVYVLYLNV